MKAKERRGLVIAVVLVVFAAGLVAFFSNRQLPAAEAPPAPAMVARAASPEPEAEPEPRVLSPPKAELSAVVEPSKPATDAGAPSGTLTGTVTLEGAPVASADVEVLGRHVTSDAQGRFTIGGLPLARPFVVTATHQGHVARAQAQVYGGQQAPRVLVLALVVGFPVSGRVTGPRHEAVAGATVSCLRTDKLKAEGDALLKLALESIGKSELSQLRVRAETQADGTYQTILPGGQWRCGASKSGLANSQSAELDLRGPRVADFSSATRWSSKARCSPTTARRCPTQRSR